MSKRNKSLSALGEWGFLNQILPALTKQKKSFLIPPGDDAAVLKNKTVLTIDGITDQTHFKSAWAKNFKKRFGVAWGTALGAKLIGSAASDLAATGATSQRWTMVFLGAPPQTSQTFLTDLFKGVQATCRRYAIAMAGGDTVKSRHLTLVAAMGGTLKKGKPFQRATARPGDYLCIGGHVGDAALGLRYLSKGRQRLSEAQRRMVRSFFFHQPQFEICQALYRSHAVTSVMDLSDSLMSSFEILARASRVGLEICWERIPRSKTFLKMVKPGTHPELSGEDYALLFTVRKSALRRLQKNVPFSVIGQVTPPSNGICSFYNGHVIAPAGTDEHFS